MLDGLRIVEASAFVAAPLGGMTLASLGADVIRIDPPGGGIDFRRWPVTADGHSLYWAGLNLGKRSVAIDTRHPEGRDLARAIVTLPGPDSGILLTNHPDGGWTDHAALAGVRPDLVSCRIVGSPDGTTAVDYTVNAAVGYPLITGPVDRDDPVNSVLPAWDLMAGLLATTGLLAAERKRSRTGQGSELRLALSDVAMAVVGYLGQIGEVQVNGVDRPRYGNHLYGAFGRDFATADGRRVMAVAITRRQFRGLVDATATGAEIASIEKARGRPLESDGDLFEAREQIAAVLEPWFAARTSGEAIDALTRHRVLVGPYRTVAEMLESDPRASTANPMFAGVDHPGIGSVLTPGSPLSGADRLPPQPAPALGQHTEEVLANLLDLSSAEIGRLVDDGVVAGA